MKNRPNVLSMRLHSVPDSLKLDGIAKVSSLYPYHSAKLSVFFVYGQDYQRQFSANLFSKLKLFIFNWTNCFVISAAVVLCFVRRLRKLRRDGFLSVLIDVMVIFTGGGRLRMDHKLERWFFVIVSIGALFLNSICLESTLFPSYLQRQQNVETFQQLTEINPPVYLAPLLERDSDLVQQMLRFVFKTIK